MEHENLSNGLDASFDIVARQEAADAALNALRGEIEEVKSRFRPSARPPLAAADGGNHELKGFVDGYLRAGRDTELKSLNTAVMGDGGFVVPTVLDQQIAERLARLSPIRSIAQVVQTTTSDYRKLIAVGAPQSGWASQTAARGETTSPKFVEIIPPSGELYANPSATQFMLDDAGFDVEGWLAGQIANEFARAEGAAFVSGNGTNQPLGFLTGTPTSADDTTRSFGTLQYLGSGDAAGLGTTPDDRLIDMVMALKPGHRQGAAWVMNAATIAQIRKVKDSTGAYIWQSSMMDGQPNRLLGYPVVEAADMPDVAAGAYPIAFGNFQNGYLITERFGTRLLRDPYSNKPYVNFYATKRVGGQVLDSDAIKLLKITA
ncbi:HK97 family phage major capsid protein [Novosphingobium sp. 1748]|uniref:phage major capsid protein n=1 Tax=Novosphingobium sp. 1748 TaxID=2817760 RepID=UPI0028604B58|nr:phage major capsid protein [Novosphingobium sp. 1748]MDR6709997.1 HK97 family phage major capsid protein [Novosphingobium sp. 1748]